MTPLVQLGCILALLVVWTEGGAIVLQEEDHEAILDYTTNTGLKITVNGETHLLLGQMDCPEHSTILYDPNEIGNWRCGTPLTNHTFWGQVLQHPSCKDGNVLQWEDSFFDRYPEFKCVEDQDTLASLKCKNGEILAKNGVAGAYYCAEDNDFFDTDNITDTCPPGSSRFVKRDGRLVCELNEDRNYLRYDWSNITCETNWEILKFNSKGELECQKDWDSFKEFADSPECQDGYIFRSKEDIYNREGCTLTGSQIRPQTGSNINIDTVGKVYNLASIDTNPVTIYVPEGLTVMQFGNNSVYTTMWVEYKGPYNGPLKLIPSNEVENFFKVHCTVPRVWECVPQESISLDSLCQDERDTLVYLGGGIWNCIESPDLPEVPPPQPSIFNGAFQIKVQQSRYIKNGVGITRWLPDTFDYTGTSVSPMKVDGWRAIQSGVILGVSVRVLVDGDKTTEENFNITIENANGNQDRSFSFPVRRNKGIFTQVFSDPIEFVADSFIGINATTETNHDASLETISYTIIVGIVVEFKQDSDLELPPSITPLN